VAQADADAPAVKAASSTAAKPAVAAPVRPAVPGRAYSRKESPAREPPGREASPEREASRARWAASDSTLRTASSSDNRSRVISDSLKGGSTLRSCAISAARARSYSARRLSPGALGSSPAMARAISG